MFFKAYKLKSNNTLKNSEKKHLCQRILEEFAAATEAKVKELVPTKSSSSCMKLVLHNGETVGVYVVDGVPMIIEAGDRLLPTVCALWKVPDLVPSLTIHSPVLSKLQTGVPLYLPGVAIPTQGIGFPLFAAGAVLACKTQDNSAVAAIGRAKVSSADMLLRATGVCLEPLQVFGDLLSKEPKFSKLERPKLPPAAYGSNTDISVNMMTEFSQVNLNQPPVREEWPSLGKPAPTPPSRLDPAPRIIRETETKIVSATPSTESVDDAGDTTLHSEVSEDSQLDPDSNIPSDMDGLLRFSLLSFLKLEGKKTELPLKTNLLYRNHMIPLCPGEQALDVKKSSYKKMGKFLEAMQKEGLIEVREIEKGVDALVAINSAHPAVRGHSPADTVRPSEPTAETTGDYTPPVVREMYCVTAAVVDVVAPIRKGTAMSPAEVRAALTDYVKRKSLQSADRKGVVVLDAVLAKLTGRAEQELMKWDELMLSMQAKMTACTEMAFADGTARTNKAKLEPVKMQVATRSGNKKVTLVSNLEAFGFSLPELSKVCQHGVAASCGVTRSPGAKADQLMVQGDQTYFIAKLLIEKYGLPKKYVEGADKALKKKK